MHMQMRDFLNPMRAGVGDHTKPFARVQCDTFGFADFRDGAHIADDFGIARLCREVVKADVGALGDHQHMRRRLGFDIAKGKRVVGFIYCFCGFRSLGVNISIYV